MKKPVKKRGASWDCYQEDSQKGDLNIQQLVSQPETVQALQSHRLEPNFGCHIAKRLSCVCLITCLQKMISLPGKSQAKTDLAPSKND